MGRVSLGRCGRTSVLLAGIALGSVCSAPGRQSDAAGVFREGAQALQRGDLDAAASDFRRVIALDPQSSAAHVNLGVTLMRKKQWADALVELQKADALRPGQAGVQLNLGLVHYRQNEFAAAIPAFRRALSLDGDAQVGDAQARYAQARYLLGLCEFFTARYAHAVESLRPLWLAQSNNLSYLYVLTIAAAKSGAAESQKQAFDRMLEVGPGQPAFHLYVGKAWLAQDNFAKAREEFREAAAADAKMPMVHHFLGRTYLQEHAYADAEKEFREDIALEPDVASNYEDLGLLYAATGEDEKAKQAFHTAIQRDGSLVSSYLGLARLQRKAGHDREALTLLDRAAELAPQNASVHYLRGQELARTGSSAQAKEEFARSAALLKSVNDRLQQEAASGQAADTQADAQDAAQE